MSGQNVSTAVMQRRGPAPDALDYFPTPPWATRAICEWLVRRGYLPESRPSRPLLCGPDHDRPSVWEPACGAGWMARPLAEYFWPVRATDVHDYSADPAWAIWPGPAEIGQDRLQDFTVAWDGPGDDHVTNRPDWIITNPPFRLAESFIDRACRLAQVGVAMIVRSAFLEGAERHRRLFEPNRPTWVVQHAERVPMVQGRCDPEANSATAYCWLVWIRAEGGRDTRLDWIAPSRVRLERGWDYGAAVLGDAADAGPLFAGAGDA